MAHYDSRMSDENDVADLQAMVMSSVLDEANRIYENIAKFIANY